MGPQTHPLDTWKAHTLPACFAYHMSYSFEVQAWYPSLEIVPEPTQSTCKQAHIVACHEVHILSNVCFSDCGAPVWELHMHPSELFHNGMISSKLLPYLSMPVSLFHQQLFHCLWCHSHQLVSSYVCWTNSRNFGCTLCMVLWTLSSPALQKDDFLLLARLQHPIWPKHWPQLKQLESQIGQLGHPQYSHTV